MMERGLSSLLFLLIPFLVAYHGQATEYYFEDNCTCCDATVSKCYYNSSKAVGGNSGLGTDCPFTVPYSLSAVVMKAADNVTVVDVHTYTFTCDSTTTSTTNTASTTTSTTAKTSTTRVVTATDKNGSPITIIVTDGDTTTTTPTTTAEKPCQDLNNNSICDEVESFRCEYDYLKGTNYKIAKIICYVATFWVVLWCLITIIVNIMHKNTGHHRWIHLLEELGIIVLWVFMGVLNLTFRNESGFCKIISIVIHYFIVMVAACFVFEAFFANSMAHGRSKKNGSLPAILNYLLPILIALAPCLVTYFMRDEYYGHTGLHCFVFVPMEYFYGFVIPVWFLLQIATLRSALGNLACDMTHDDQDRLQCYWAKKSCKMMSYLAYFIFMAYLTCMFGSSQQKLWVLIIFVVQSLFLGPLIFVCHTFVHEKTARKWYKSSCFGRFYTPCAYPAVPPLFPAAPPPPMDSPSPRKPRRTSSPLPSPSPPPPRHRPKPKAPPPLKPPPQQQPDEHMVASELWGWSTKKGQNERRDEILFRPRAM